MFGLFTPKCPLDTAEKVWVERRMLWFAERFGIDRMRNARVVTPTDEFFPDRYDGDIASVRRCLDRICGYMGVDPTAITLEVLPDEYMPNAAGWYEMRARSNICIAHSQLADPTKLMATLAHEVAHEILLRGGHLTGNEPDHEHATDLLPAFLSIGIFGANATIREGVTRYGHASAWWISIQGYLSMYVLGYALALFAFVRNERWPAWRKHLRPDVRGTFEKGLRFLQKTGDALFTPETAGLSQPAPTAASVLDRLAHPSPTYRVAGLWDLIAGRLTDPRLLDPVVDCLSHSNDTVCFEAAWAVSVFGTAAHAAIPRLVKLLDRDPSAPRAAALCALGLLRAEPNRVVPELVEHLRDVHSRPSWDTIDALRGYGRDATAALPKLLEHFEICVARNDELTTSMARALRAICPDPRAAIREHIGARDPELLRLALNELATTPTDPTDPRCAPPPMQWAIPFPRAPR